MRTITAMMIGLVLLLSLLAQAQLPPEDATDTFTSPAGETCAFDVEFQLSGKAATIELGGGQSITIFPGFAVTMTNGNTGTQITISATGSFHNTVLANGNTEIVYTGRNLILDPEAGFVLAIGTFRAVYDPTGEVVEPLSGNGQLIDVCELLA